uniref:Headcase domain-containing protein n=1 Tax=Anopheles atroparvus TaxID=41427 RepID=A0A182JHC0_ANOAO
MEEKEAFRFPYVTTISFQLIVDTRFANGGRKDASGRLGGRLQSENVWMKRYGETICNNSDSCSFPNATDWLSRSDDEAHPGPTPSFQRRQAYAWDKTTPLDLTIEDEGNHGNDETRLFILSSLAAQHKSRVACVLCEEPMLVFDRYPLVDGTFFLSPKQHAKGCIEVKYENRVQYLTSVCMACLDGVEMNRAVRCRFCVKKWDGSSLVLGTMYSYDIFAAMPCCTERLKCNNCFKLLLHPNQRLNFYSDYSRSVPCPYCTAQDNHFVKPLTYCYTKQPHQLFQHWP